MDRLGGGALLQLGLDGVQVVGALHVPAGGQVLGLGAHVLDLGQLQHAVLLGLVQGAAGGVGVDVDLKGRVVLADHQAVADGVEVSPEGFQVGVLLKLADDKHCVEGKGDVLHVDGFKISLVVGGSSVLPGLGHGQAPDLVQHALENHEEALAAGVYHAGLFQHRVLVDGAGQGLLALLNGGLQHPLEGAVLPGLTGGPGGGQTGDGEDGALGGLHHRLVGGGHTEVQGDGQVPAVHDLLVLDGLGEAPEQQREDDP